MTRRALGGVALVLALALVRCTPDFDSLSRGVGDAAGGTSSSQAGSGSSPGGTGSGGQPGAAAGEGSTASSGRGGVDPVGGDGGGGSGVAGTESGAGVGGAAGAPGEGGAAGSPLDCSFPHAGATIFNGFDDGLDGTGFEATTTTSSAVTTHGAQTTSAWDPLVGKTCPGSLELVARFKAYASGSETDEIAFLDLRFANADWSGAKALHAWVKVEPGSAPIVGLRFFVISGSTYLFRSVLQTSSFDVNGWTELVLPLQAGADYDPTMVYRVGLQVPLKRDGASGNPAVPPTVDVWMDELWLQE